MMEHVRETLLREAHFNFTSNWKQLEVNHQKTVAKDNFLPKLLLASSMFVSERKTDL